MRIFADGVDVGALLHEELCQCQPALNTEMCRYCRKPQRGALLTIPIFPDGIYVGALLHEELRQRQPALFAVT